MGIAWRFVIPGGGPNTLFDRLTPWIFLLIALALVLAMAYVRHRTGGASFLPALLFSLSLTALGALILSVVIWRSHWFQVFYLR